MKVKTKQRKRQTDNMKLQKRQKMMATLCILLLVLMIIVSFIMLPENVKAETSFGKTTTSATLFGTAADRIFGSVFISSEDADGTPETFTMSLYGNGTEGSHLKLGIALNSTLIIQAVSDPITIDSTDLQWWNATFSSVPDLNPSTYYFLFGIGDAYFTPYYTTGSGQIMRDSTNSYASPTDPTDAANEGVAQMSIYTTFSMTEEDWNWMGGDYSGYYNVTAASGISEDIQAAVDDAHENGTYPSAGYGNVFIPAGNYSWSLTDSITVYDGVNIFGASPAGCKGHGDTWEDYIATTIIHQEGQAHIYMVTFGGQTAGAYVRKSSRIAGIQFETEAPIDLSDESTNGSEGVRMWQIPDFRIDHCTFVNFGSKAILYTSNDGISNVNVSCYGVIDHNVITNPYKLTSETWLWAYGIIGEGNIGHETDKQALWETETPVKTSFFGQYGWVRQQCIAYIEDNHISYCRHSVSLNGGAYATNRFNLIDYPACAYSAASLDVHGAGYPAGRGSENYNNTIYGAPDNLHVNGVGAYYANAMNLRSGSGLFYNNTFICDTNSANNYFVVLNDNGDFVVGRDYMNITKTYIWENSYTNCTFGSIEWDLTENVDYFLRAPTLEDDGFNYNTYPYPHPLVSGEAATYHTLTVQSTTGGSVSPSVGAHSLLEGANQTLIAAANYGYEFVDWEIGGVNQTATSTWYVYMDNDYTAKAYFQVDDEAVFTLTLSISNPQNTTYTFSSIPISLSSSGNDTNPVYSWNVYFSNGTAFYGTNQTGTSTTVTANYNATNLLFACQVTGDFGTEDYGEVYFSVNLTGAENWNPSVRQLFQVVLPLILLLAVGYMFVSDYNADAMTPKRAVMYAISFLLVTIFIPLIIGVIMAA